MTQGNGNRAALAALRDQEPARGVHLLRLLWPEIRAALERGHTIRVIHERLRETGVSISYRQLCTCIARFRRECNTVDGPPRTHLSDESSISASGNRTDDSAGGKDPLANVREMLAGKRPGFNYDSRLPNKAELIG